MANLFNCECTIYNQIPKSATDSTIVAWKKSVVNACNVQGGVQDKSKGSMQYVSGGFTVITKDTGRYLPANFEENGYYKKIQNTDELDFFTAAANDFIIFGKIADPAPLDANEFSKLKSKYKLVGMVIKEVREYIYGRKTDNITMIKP